MTQIERIIANLDCMIEIRQAMINEWAEHVKRDPLYQLSWANDVFRLSLIHI